MRLRPNLKTARTRKNRLHSFGNPRNSDELITAIRNSQKRVSSIVPLPDALMPFLANGHPPVHATPKGLKKKGAYMQGLGRAWRRVDRTVLRQVPYGTFRLPYQGAGRQGFSPPARIYF